MSPRTHLFQRVRFFVSTWLVCLPALVVASEWRLPENFTNGGFQMEWMRISRTSSTAPWTIISREIPALKTIDVFFSDSLVTNGIGGDQGQYTVPSVIYNQEQGLLQLHPGYNTTMPDEKLAMMSWTAPATGEYVITGEFAAANIHRTLPNFCCANGVDYWIFLNDEITNLLWGAPAPAISAAATRPFDPDASNPFAFTRVLQQGDRLQFAVRPRNGENYDASLLRLQIRNAEGLPPVIAGELRDAQLAGAFVTLNFPASGSGIGYQWFRDEQFYTNSTTSQIDYRPAASPSLTRFQVIATNGYGAVTSRVALVANWPRPYVVQLPPARIITTNQMAVIDMSWIANSLMPPNLYRNGVFVERDYTTFSQAAFQVRTNGTYTIRLEGRTGTNSNPVQVFFIRPVPEPPTLSLPLIASGSNFPHALKVAVEAGRSYRLETSTNLFEWSPLTEWFAEVPNPQLSLPPPPTNSFYRLVMIPTP